MSNLTLLKELKKSITNALCCKATPAYEELKIGHELDRIDRLADHLIEIERTPTPPMGLSSYLNRVETCKSELLLRSTAFAIGMNPDDLDSWIKKKLSPWNQDLVPDVPVRPAESYKIFDVKRNGDSIVVVASADRSPNFHKPPPVPKELVFRIPRYMRELNKPVFYTP